MSSRRNYLDADNSIMERNLRFVKNDLEDNLNQYFGGSGSRGNNSTTVTAPPRDYKVVQPKPGGSHAHAQSFGLEQRRGFLLQLGLARHEAYELAKNSDFDVNRYEQKCEEWLDRGIRQAEVNHKILSEIRNENTWNNNVGHNDYEMSPKTPTVPFTATCIEERDNLNRDRGYSQIYEERYCRNRSRSRSHSYDPQSNDYREERHHQSISRSPNRGLNSMYERKNEEYFSQQVNSRDAVKRDAIREGSGPRICSPFRSDRRGERYQSSRSRSPNRAINTMRERRNEEYVLQHDNFRPEVGRDTMRKRSRSYSPPTNYRREERNQLSRSRSPNRGFHNRNDEEYYVRQDNNSVDVRRDTIHEESHLPPRNNSREERYQSARSPSPNIGFNLVQDRESEIFLIERDNFRTIRERSRSRPYSPPRNDHREELYQSTRSRSPTRGFNDRNPCEYFSQPQNFRKTIRERSRSRAYSPPINDHREEFYQSSNSRSPNRSLNSRNNRRSEDFRLEIRRDTMGFAPSPSTATRFPSENKNKYGNTQRGPNSSRNIPTQQNREIPSLLGLDTFPIQTKSSHAHNIPSLLTLQVFPDKNNVQQSLTSGEGNRYNNESNRKQISQYGNNKQSKLNNNKGKTQQMKKEPNANSQCLREHVSKIPIIQCGLAKPPPGHLKANPKEYWSQWWPQYKYIEYSVPKINPKDNEVKTCINFMFKPHELEFRRSRHMLLGKGVNAIMKTVDINETNYYVRDIYKLFKYKKHLEDQNFLNNLGPQDLNCIAPALRQFKIKSTMAFLHQALICRWHISLNIIKKVQAGEPIRSNYARILLNEKCFHYLVMESIQELKKMCQQDWPQFAEFYKNLKATKVDIYALGVGPNLGTSNANFVYKLDADDEYDDSF